MKNLATVVLIAVFLLAWAISAHAESVTISGPSKMIDTYLNDDTACQNRNYGGLVSFQVGRWKISNAYNYSALLRFDLTQDSVLSGAAVVSAKVRLKCLSADAGTLTFDVYRMNARWIEGAGNGTATASDREPTFLHQLYDTVEWNWDSDINAEPETSVTTTITSGWLEFDVTESVRAWLADPLSNKGLLLRPVYDGVNDYTSREFASSDNTNSGDHPQLVIEYAPAFTESTEATGGAERLVVGISDAQPIVGTEYSSTVLEDRPAGYWRLEESSGSIMTDSSGNGRNGEYVGTFTYGVNDAAPIPQSTVGVSKTGGSANRMRADNAAFTPNGNASSVEMWIKTQSTSGYVFTWYSNTYALRFMELQSNGTLIWRVRDKDGLNSNTIYGTKVVNDNTWHHVVATADPGTNLIQLYVDGQLDASSSSVEFGTLDGSGWLHYGGWTSDPDAAIDISYDELAYYTYELSAVQIQLHYQALVLRAKTINSSYSPLDYTFTAIPANFSGTPTIGTVSGVANGSLAVQRWVPTTPGIYNIKVEAKQGSTTRYSTYMRVAVVKTNLHFPYSAGSVAEKSRYVTIVQDDAKAAFWTARGVTPICYFPDYSTVSRWEELWNSSCLGAMIDEMHGDSGDPEIAQKMIDYHGLHPGHRLIPFSPLVYNNSTVTDAYRDVAHLICVETYSGNPISYSPWIDNRYNSFVNNGYAGKSIAALIMPSDPSEDWITTRSELRRQVRHDRRLAPDMPGIVLYSFTSINGVRTALDEALEDYFLGPALYPTLTADSVVVENIGQTDAEEFDVVCYSASGVEVDRRYYSGLAAQSQDSYARPANASYVRIENKGKWTSVIDATEDYEAVPTDKEQPLTVRGVSSTTSQNFSSDPGLTIERDGSNAVIDGYYPIDNMSDSMTLSFDITFNTINIYGWVKVGLADSSSPTEPNGKNVFRFWFYRSDDESGAICRARLEYIDSNGIAVKDLMCKPLEQGNTYHCILHYEKGKYVRGIMKDSSGNRLWDSGELSISGLNNLTVTPNEMRMRFDVRPYAGISAVSISGGVLNLIGSAGAGYTMDATVDNVMQEYVTID